MVHRLRVDQALPLPRNLEYAASAFPPAALRRRTVLLPRYHSLASLPSDELVVGAHGVLDRLRPDGTIVRLALLTGVGAGDAGMLYALDYLGGRITRVTRTAPWSPPRRSSCGRPPSSSSVTVPWL